MRYLPFLLLCFSIACSPKPAIQQTTNINTADAYLAARQSLLAADQQHRFDANMQLSERESQLNQKLVSFRKQILADYNKQNFFPPAAPFHRSKTHIEGTPLFKLLKKMPKGGALHLHFDAVIDYHWVVDKAIATPNSYVFLDKNSAENPYGKIHFYREGQAPKGYVEMSQADRANPNFRKELHDLLTLQEEVLQDTLAIWDEFEYIFDRIRGFYTYEPILKDFYRQVIKDMIADGVQHLEDRTILGDLYDLEHQTNHFPLDTRIKYIQEVAEEVKKTHPDFTISLIYTHLRFLPKEVIWEEYVKAFEMRKKYPDLIKGFDLVANEDSGNRTLFYLDNWLKKDSLEQAYGFELPFYFHDGESDWASVQNLYDAVLLNSRRIGHGFNLSHFPTLKKEIIAKDICLEICPLSNQILGYLKDLRVHPANYLLKEGVQCVISSDDPAIFGYKGLTYDYWSIFLAWELDLKALKKLSRNSITYSSLEPEAKAKAMQAWEKRWEVFLSVAEKFFMGTD